jgi:CheY-like chemotaxis protein
MYVARAGQHLAGTQDRLFFFPGCYSYMKREADAGFMAKHSKMRVLSVSYDDLLLRMRQMILENAGYTVVSALGFEKGLEECKKAGFDLFILGHSIPYEEKGEMVKTFRQACTGVVISLQRGASEPRVVTADFHVDPYPEPLLKLIGELRRKRLLGKSKH